MDSRDIMRIAEESMKENRELLNNLGYERKIKLNQNPDKDIIKKLTDLMPKSTEGKLLAAGAALLLAYIIFKK